jgi:hypothetical protein
MALKCPHCQTTFSDHWANVAVTEDPDGSWWVRKTTCSEKPRCGRAVLVLDRVYPAGTDSKGNVLYSHETTTIHPRTGGRAAPAPEVPADYVGDYVEACRVLIDSPQASAALSRRVLQHLIRKQAKIKGRDLADEIQKLIDGSALPGYIAEQVDSCRQFGNFAAHPVEDKMTGAIVPVEPGEAEWALDTLEALFDFYFVQPAIIARRRAETNRKLADAGKPPMK